MQRFDRKNRRRAILTARRIEERQVLGFSMRSSHALVDLDTCPILVDELNQALEPVREMLTAFEKVRGDIRINMLAADNGIDLAFSFSGKHSSGIIRALTTHKAATHFLRLSVNGETVLERQRPILAAGKTNICPPPGAFVQASKQAEQKMAELVSTHLGNCKKVADLFCGFGTFGLRLAEHSQVHGCESDTSALKAMDDAWRQTGGKLKMLTHEKRDLFRRPMMVKELKSFDGVVFDPPRAGAEAQARELAKSTVRRIAAVSCNPVTLARDVAIFVSAATRSALCIRLTSLLTPHILRRWFFWSGETSGQNSDWENLKTLALGLPDVIEATRWGNPCPKAQKRPLVCRSPAKTLRFSG